MAAASATWHARPTDGAATIARAASAEATAETASISATSAVTLADASTVVSEAQVKLAKLALDVGHQLNGPDIASALKDQQALMARLGEIVRYNHAYTIEMDSRLGALYQMMKQRGRTIER